MTILFPSNLVIPQRAVACGGMFCGTVPKGGVYEECQEKAKRSPSASMRHSVFYANQEGSLSPQSHVHRGSSVTSVRITRRSRAEADSHDPPPPSSPIRLSCCVACLADLGMICEEENLSRMLVGSDFFVEEVLLSIGLSALTCLTLPAELTDAIKTLSAIIASYRVLSPLTATVEAVLHDVVTIDSVMSSRSRTMTNTVGAGTKGILWLVWIVFSARAMGFEMDAVVASIGVGGVSIGFALQSVLKDMFASCTLVFEEVRSLKR